MLPGWGAGAKGPPTSQPKKALWVGFFARAAAGGGNDDGSCLPADVPFPPLFRRRSLPGGGTARNGTS